MRTIDHDTIRDWVESRGWHPAVASSTREEGGGMLRLDTGSRERDIERISWEEFCRILDKDSLAFVYEEEKADDEEIYYYEIVPRNAAETGEDDLEEISEGEVEAGTEAEGKDEDEEEEGIDTEGKKKKDTEGVDADTEEPTESLRAYHHSLHA